MSNPIYQDEKHKARREYMKKWYMERPEKHKAQIERTRKWRLNNLYGTTKEELLLKFGNICPLCGDELDLNTTSQSERICIDHDHLCCPGIKTCGKCIRGLLHHRCNTGLGCFKDNPQTCLNAAAYLTKYLKRKTL